LGKNDINLDQINARLGRSAKPRADEPYNDPQERLRGSRYDDGDGPREPGKGIFVAAIAGIFALVFGGTLVATGSIDLSKGVDVASLWGGNAADYNSVAAACTKGWVPRAQNDTQLLCLMNTNVARLCNPEERAHLVAMYNRYSKDRGRFEDDRTARGLRAAVVMQGTQGELRDALQSNFKDLQARIDGTVSPSSGVPDRLSGYFAKVNDAAGQSEDERVAERVPRVSDRVIASAIRRLAAAGYVGKWDFGWLPDSIVRSAFDGLDNSANTCKA